MRIGIDCRMMGSSFTGIGRYVRELVNNFIELNDKLPSPHELVLFLSPQNNKDFKNENPHIKKVLINAPHYSLKEQTVFLWKLWKEHLDMVHFPHFNVPIFYRRPYVVTVHDLTLSFFPGKKMTGWYQRFAYQRVIKNAVKKAKKIIAVSKNTKKDIIEELDIPEQKIVVIYNGISENFIFLKDPKITKETLKKFEIKKQFLLYTGVWRNHKNLPNLLKAFKIIREEKGLDLNLVITGKPDPHYPEVVKLVRELNLQNDVIFTGLISEEKLNHLYNAAFIYVFPSLYEGFGLPPLESMKCGTPVAASNIASIPEVCGEENAIYFDPYNENDIAEKIYMLAKDSSLQASLIEKGLLHAEKFSWYSSAKRTFKLLIQIEKNV